MIELLEYTFFRNAIAGISIISIAAAIIGSYIITRRMVSIAGGITHACFGGLGLGYFFGINPIITASVFAIASSIGVEWMSARHKVREDSAIAVVWALGMAIGVLFVFLTPGYVPELNSFLFGNILTISSKDLWLFGIFTTILIIFFIAFYRKIIAIAFDRDYAKVSHLPVKTISYIMTIFIAICIVLTIRLIGIMLLISMLSLPQMIAEVYCHKFKSIIISAIIISFITGIIGLLVSTVMDVPCSATIVLILVIFFIISHAIKWILRKHSNAIKNQ